MQDVPDHLRNGLNDDDPENSKNIKAYNEWASDHEHIMAKSLFSAGTTWPGVFFAEDRKALDILCARNDVDASTDWMRRLIRRRDADRIYGRTRPKNKMRRLRGIHDYLEGFCS